MTVTLSLRSLLLAAVLLAAGLFAGLAIAQDEGPDLSPVKADTTFMAVLNGGQAVPATTSPAMGVALLTLDRKTNVLRYSVTYSGLEGEVTHVHVHAGAAGDVRKPALFHLHGANGVRNGETEPLSKKVVKLLKRGQCYVNVHTDQHTEGEIRGQLLPVKGVR